MNLKIEITETVEANVAFIVSVISIYN